MISPEIQERVDKLFERKNLRRTGQRQAIIEAIFESRDHFTADELWESVRSKTDRASRATVYRTISLLVEGRMLRELDLGRDQKVYDPNFVENPDHNHLICVDCGILIEFEDSHVQVLQDCITRRMGFKPTFRSLRIEACCDQLRKTGMCKNLLTQRLGKAASGRRAKAVHHH